MSHAIWTFFWFVECLVHYSWFVWGTWLVGRLSRIKKIVVNLGLASCSWVLVVFLCHGCPFSYLEQWLLVQAGRKHAVVYTYQDSVAYQYVINPIQKTVAKVAK
jgi:hypothetical protein